MIKICPKCGKELVEYVIQDMLTGEEVEIRIYCSDIRCDYKE